MSSYYSIFFLSSLCLFLSKKADLVLSYLQYAVPFSMNPGVYGNTVWPQKPVFGCSSCPLKKKKKSMVLDSSVRLGTVETAWLDAADWSHTTPYPWALRHSWLILWSTTCQKIVKKMTNIIFKSPKWSEVNYQWISWSTVNWSVWLFWKRIHVMNAKYWFSLRDIW